MIEDGKEAGVDWAQEWASAVSKAHEEENGTTPEDLKNREQRGAALLTRLDAISHLVKLAQGNLTSDELTLFEAKVGELAKLAVEVSPSGSAEAASEKTAEELRQEMDRLIPQLPEMVSAAAWKKEDLEVLKKGVAILLKYETSEHQAVDYRGEKLGYFWRKTLEAIGENRRSLKIAFHLREVFNLLDQLGTVLITKGDKRVPLSEVKAILSESEYFDLGQVKSFFNK